MGEKPAQLAALYESQKVCPGVQNCAPPVKIEAWPISQTKLLGVSKTIPHPSALPTSCVSNAGITIGLPALALSSSMALKAAVSRNLLVSPVRFILKTGEQAV